MSQFWRVEFFLKNNSPKMVTKRALAALIGASSKKRRLWEAHPKLSNKK